MSYQLGADSDRHSELFGEPRDQEARPRSRGLVRSLIAVSVMGVFAGALWFAYMQGLRHGNLSSSGADVPLIRADERPTKVKPENPGGMEIPDRDKLIYTQKRAAVEHLLPPPEKPMPRPTASPKTPVKTPSAPAGPAKPAAAQETPTNAHGGRIQLGSVRSEDGARQEWDRIKRTNADLLASISATPIRADLGEKGVFYRIQTGTVADAERICSELKRRNVGCIIAR